jgi:tRNA A-37 threonylcarbamoyl transferase component Bud32
MANEFLTRSEEVVDGTYRLGAVVSRSVRSVVYETEAGAGPAVIKVREAEPADAAQQAERWKEAMKFSHPNLLRVYGAGLCVLHDAPVAYVAMERADESLAGVLAERSLSEEETTEMLGPTLSALAYLHKNGYAHGSVKASNVMAAGDKLKLSSDSAVRTADGGSTAEDVRALGALIVEALPEAMSAVFTDIVAHCLEADPEQRWTVEQVEKRFYAPDEPGVDAVPVTPVAERAERVEEEAPARGMPKWILAGLAALVLLVVLAAVVRHFAGGNDTQQAVVPAPVIASDGVSAGAPVGPSPIAGRKAGVWSVIVAAYGSREAAEKRMKTMARKFTGFSLSVQEQKADRARYLVVLGKGLSENDAEALRKRGVGAGLPRDTYIKKVM